MFNDEPIFTNGVGRLIARQEKRCRILCQKNVGGIVLNRLAQGGALADKVVLQSQSASKFEPIATAVRVEFCSGVKIRNCIGRSVRASGKRFKTS